MDLRDQDVRHVARLARLRLTDEEIDGVRQDLNRVLGYVSKLHELDLQDVAATMHVVTTRAPLRDDQVSPSLAVAEAVKNGPVVRGSMFVVPRIMDGGDGVE